MPGNALVTGASSGLGREFVRQLVRDRGMTVLATARRLDRLRDLASELPAGAVLVEAGDVADPGFRDRLWERARSLPGGLDLLVNNAGVGRYGDLAGQDFDAVRRVYEVNVVALTDLTRRAAADMTARGSGLILQVSSVLGFFGFPYSSTYVASKHAVNGLVKSLRYELRGTGVRVRAACPTRTVSEFSEVALGDPGATGPVSRGEPTDRVVRSFVRRLDGTSAFLYPSWQAWALVAASHWLPGPFDAALARFAPRLRRRELDRARGVRGDGP